jgi:arsenite methyltransferase
MSKETTAALVERVRSRYAEAAQAVLNPHGDPGCGCGPSCCGTAEDAAPASATPGCCDTSSCCGGTNATRSAALDTADCFGGSLYREGEVDGLPAEAVLASLGCGNPLAVADLHEGERVLDLGSGGALAAASVDVVISNCVINLSTDKAAVLAEMFRVLVPGGRIGISDVVAEDHLSAADRTAAGSYVGCIAGALSRTEYLEGLAAAGFADPSVTFAAQAAPGMHSAIIRAVKPAA